KRQDARIGLLGFVSRSGFFRLPRFGPEGAGFRIGWPLRFEPAARKPAHADGKRRYGEEGRCLRNERRAFFLFFLFDQRHGSPVRTAARHRGSVGRRAVAALPSANRKSTRLNSSHVKSS